MHLQLESWIARAQSGEQKAFYHIYHQFKGKVFAICFRLLADRCRAEDACQEVFVRIWQQLPTFRGESNFATWLHTIATRTAVDVWRKHKHEHFSNETALEALGVEDISDDPALERAICKLPEQARAVFVLFALEGFGHEEIANLLDIAPGTSKAQYHRARQLLRGWLDDQGA